MDTQHWAEAAPFRRHVRHIISHTGLSWRLIAAHAGLSPRALRTLLHGRPQSGRPVDRIHITTARALLALDVDDLLNAEEQPVYAGDVRQLLGTLHRLGHDTSQLTRWLTNTDVDVLSNRRLTWCSAGTRARVQACHDQLLDHLDPDSTPGGAQVLADWTRSRQQRTSASQTDLQATGCVRLAVSNLDRK